MPANIILLDAPEEEFCESRGWASADMDEDTARELLAEFCADEHGETPARPVGPATRVWLKPNDADLLDGDQRWYPCNPDEDGAVEFWEFDATDVKALDGSA